MDGHLRLSARERNTCLKTLRAARSARRALILLLLAEGQSYRAIGVATFASPTLIRSVKRDFAAGRLGKALRTEEVPAMVPSWLIIVVRWLLKSTPQDFRFFRTRWSCALLALLLWEQEGVRLSPETIRRGLHRMRFVWRRPRPVVGPRDPEHARKLRQIQRFIAQLPANETVVFQDEVDVHLNPKIGSMWMPRGQQAEVVTPGNNEKRHLAGSLHWRTGRLLLSAPGTQRNASLFLTHLDDLRRQLRRYRVIHVICDNAKFHDCHAVRAYLARHGDRIVLHFLPKYAPETNPTERVWWHLHETITRNHRCRSIDELLSQVTNWAQTQKTFYLQTASFRDRYSFAA
jgi:putative transposase